MARGGARIGAGRPKNVGKYKEPTKVLRVPLSMVSYVAEVIEGSSLLIPLYGGRVAAGIPADADDYVEDRIDIAKHLIKHPSETFYCRAHGLSMKDAGINDGALLVVDRSIAPTNGKIVVASLNGEMTVKFLINIQGKQYLKPANPQFDDIPIDAESGVTIWGVVVNAINEY